MEMPSNSPWSLGNPAVTSWGYLPNYDRLARRCVGFDRTTVSPLAFVPMWCKPINTTHPFLAQFRAYVQQPIAPFLFGGVARSGLLTGADPSAPPVTPISGLTPILKFEIAFLTDVSGTSSPRHSPAHGTEPVSRPVPTCGSRRLPVEIGGALVERSHTVSGGTSCACRRLPRRVGPLGVSRLAVGFDLRGGVFRGNVLDDAQTDRLWMTAVLEGMYGLRQRPDHSFCPAVEPSPAPLLDSCRALAVLKMSVGHPPSSIGCRLTKSDRRGARTEW